MIVASRFEPRSETVAIGEPFRRFTLIMEAGNVLPLAARVRSNDTPPFSRLKRRESEAHVISGLHHAQKMRRRSADRNPRGSRWEFLGFVDRWTIAAMPLPIMALSSITKMPPKS